MRQSAVLAVLALLLATALSGCATRPAEPVRVTVLAINDFHGNLKPPTGGLRTADPADRRQTVSVRPAVPSTWPAR